MNSFAQTRLSGICSVPHHTDYGDTKIGLFEADIGIFGSDGDVEPTPKHRAHVDATAPVGPELWPESESSCESMAIS